MGKTPAEHVDDGPGQPPEGGGSHAPSREFNWRRVLLTTCVVAAAGGLGWYAWDGSASPPAKLVPIRAQVYYNGEPLPAGQIGTQVVGRPELMGGIGFVDAEGRFDLMTNGQMGAYVGRHKVMVLLMSGVPPRSLLPAEYGTASTTPLEMNVTGDPEQNQFEFHLTGERALPTAKPAPSMPYPGPRGGTGTRGRDEPAATDEDVGNP